MNLKNTFRIKTGLVAFLLIVCCIARSQSGTCDTSSACNGQGLCCGEDPTPAGVMISHTHAKNEWMLSYRYMNMVMSGVNGGDKSITNSEILSGYAASPIEMRMNMHMLMLMYGITDRLTAMSMFHYNTAWMKMSMKMGSTYHAHNMNMAAMSDVKLSAIYAVVKQHNSQLLLCAGSSIPVGSIEMKGESGSMMYPGKRYPYSMQAGSGTFDVLPSISYLAQHQNIYYSVQTFATLRTGINRAGYRLGNEYGLMGWLAYRWLPFLSSSLRLEGTLINGITGEDPTLDPTMEIAANKANYGGKRLNTYIGSVLKPAEGRFKTSKLSFEFGMPLYQYYKGYQMNSTYNLLITYNLNF